MPVMCTAWSEDRKHTASAMSWSESQSTGSRERCVVKNLGEAFAAARMGIPMIDFVSTPPGLTVFARMLRHLAPTATCASIRCRRVWRLCMQCRQAVAEQHRRRYQRDGAIVSGFTHLRDERAGHLPRAT